MLWVHTGNMFLATVYRLLKSVYQTESLLSYMDLRVEDLIDSYPSAQFDISGNVNQSLIQEIKELFSSRRVELIYLIVFLFQSHSMIQFV